ncbi:cupin domain-containing protein [Pendulispora rubella]|uniref:Cupin domain-containing protein n=1 Tax=Pendulispora rubella TaxID=2741070 RepID=A0ABZ2KS98_9BACT
MSSAIRRPPFIISAADVPEETHRYPRSDEPMAPSRAMGRAAGLLKIGLHLQRVPPGYRISWPHAESQEEEFVYVLQGEVDAWIDGDLHRMRAGDLAAFPSGTGICHTFLNDGPAEATLLVGGEASKSDNRILYPLHPQRRDDMPWSHWWDAAPARAQGPHDGKPNALRAKENSSE